MILNEKQAITWKAGQKTGKQENLQKTGKNRKTGSVGTLVLLKYLYHQNTVNKFPRNVENRKY